MANIITVTSGKGGVGKTNLCANLAMQLASMDYHTCIFDADLGLANINIVFGLYPEHTIDDVVLQEKPLSDIIIQDYHGIDIIPGSSGVERIANLEPDKIQHLIKSFSVLDEYDYLLIDTAAGVSKNVISFCLSSSEIILVITPEPTSLTDAYALLKILCINGLRAPIKVVVNQCKDTTIAKQTYSRFKEVVKKYLGREIQALGVMLHDVKISDAVRKQLPFITMYPNSTASKCIRAIANNIIEGRSDDFQEQNIATFWNSFVDYFKSSLNLDGTLENKKRALDPEAPLPVLEPAAEAAPEPQPVAAPEPQPIQEFSAAAAQEPLTAPQPAAEAVHEPQPVQEPAAPAAPESFASPPDMPAVLPAAGQLPALDKNMYHLLDRLVSSIASISKEVKCLRKAVEGNGSLATTEAAAPQDSAKPKHAPIVLDFDVFLENRHR
ncbi:P-loop NTPase [Thermodesulfobacteriota bacterium]